MMSRILLLVALLAVDPLVVEGVQHYKRGRYPEAVKVLERALATVVTEVGQRNYARAYLAAAYDAQHDSASATKTFRAMVEEDADATIDASRFSPELVALFERVKSERPARTEPVVRAEVSPPSKSILRPETLKPSPPPR